jgi:tetratricopeptide (TPR) repeat protein
VPAPVRRNAPCPCGSGRRYKECHGALAAADGGIDAVIQRSLALHQQGRVDDAVRGYHEALERAPGHAVATHYLGLASWHRGDVDGAERMMRASIAADASIADFHNNLGLLLRDTGRLDEALACFRRTLEVDRSWFEAYNNLGLTLEAAGRWDEAIAAYRAALAAQPSFAAAHQNLARALLTRGDYAQGWSHYRWRLAAQGLAAAPPDPRSAPLPASLAGQRLVLRAEQGLGDVLFFLRFAPELVRRGAQLAFRGDPRLHSMLARTGLFALGLEADSASAPEGAPLFVGDLPWLLEAASPERFPAPLPLSPEPARVERLRAALHGAGPQPWIAFTWRGGVACAGPARTQVKELAPADREAALREVRGTLIGIQRQPRPDEYPQLRATLERPVHDFSAVNDDLEDMLALLSLVDHYVGVSNANAHLRASLGGSMDVYVPNPPEWRWGVAGTRSPWFPAVRIHRQ